MRMKSTIYTAVLLLVSLVSCTTIKMGVPEEFSRQATQLRVKGVNKLFNKKLNFGEYSTSKVKSGWIKSHTKRDRASDITTTDRLARIFNIEKENTTTIDKTKYQYTLYGNNFEAKVFCMEKKSTEQLEIKTNTRLLGDLITTKNFQYSFSAAILPLIQNDDAPWQLVIYNNYDAKKDTAKHFWHQPYVEEEGYATNGKETITLRVIRTKNITTNKGKELKMPVRLSVGYELRIDDGLVAIIDTFDDNNNVWIYNDLDSRTKFIVASISSAILLRKIGSSGS